MKATLPIISALLLSTSLEISAGSPPPVLWSYCAVPSSCPAIGPDGTIYVAGLNGLHAVSPFGTNKWIFPHDVASAAPAVGTNGTVYFGSRDGNLYAVNPDGTQRWAYAVNTNLAVTIDSSPAISDKGTIYFVALSTLFALNPDGSQKWAVYIGDSANSPPVVAPDGTIYVGSTAPLGLLALNPDGSQRWLFESTDGFLVSPAIGSDGTIYAASSRGVLFALSPGSAELWRNDTVGLTGSPVLGIDGTIYIGAPRDLGLFALSSSGATNWEAAAIGQNPYMATPTTPAIDAGGMLYYAVSNSLYALRPDGAIAWTFATGPIYGTPPTEGHPTIGPDGTIYIILRGCLYALQGTNSLARSPWPKFRQNLRNTGKVEKPSLNQPQRRSDGAFQFRLQGELGQGYTVQTSTNLSTWTPLINLTATNVPMDIIDFTAPNIPVRFYRATSP